MCLRSLNKMWWNTNSVLLIIHLYISMEYSWWMMSVWQFNLKFKTVNVLCLARKQSQSNPDTNELAKLNAHQSAGCSRSTRTRLVSLLIYVSVHVKVYEFHPGATQRDAGRPSDSSRDGWPLVCLERRATAQDEGSRKFAGSRVKPRPHLHFSSGCMKSAVKWSAVQSRPLCVDH